MIENTDFTIYVACDRMQEHRLDVNVDIEFTINKNYDPADWGDERIWIDNYTVNEVKLVNNDLKEREINYDVVGKTKIYELIEQYIYDEYA
jgi:hypothetical protein